MGASNSNGKESRQKFWKSLRVLNNEPEVVEMKKHEFAEGVTSEFDVDKMSPVSRRRFLALLGVSTAFAATSCNNYRDKGEIMPYVTKPESIMPGIPNYYASTYTGNKYGWGILIKTREGRPVKIDGNPNHPVNKGKIDSKVQASLLNLYDPSRLRFPKKLNKSDMILYQGDYERVEWADADKGIIKKLEEAKAKGKEIAFLTDWVSSPTFAKILREFRAKYSNTMFYNCNPVNDDNRRIAWLKCYGTGEPPFIKWQDANVILTLEADILGTEGEVPLQTNAYASRRDVDKPENFNRLYSVEGQMSLTGTLADYRLRVTPEDQPELLMTILNEVRRRITPKVELSVTIESKINSYTIDGFCSKHGVDKSIVYYLVEDLVTNAGKSIVYAGDCQNENVHILVNLLNAVLGNDVLYDNDVKRLGQWLGPENFGSVDELASKLKSGRIGALINIDTNPVYTLPADYGIEESLENVDFIISLVEFENESTLISDYILPINHNFESWGDHQYKSNVVSLQQPVIQPLYDSRQKEAIILNWLSDTPENYKETDYHQYLKKRWQEEIYPISGAVVNADRFWYSALHDGFYEPPKPEEDVINPAFNIETAENFVFRPKSGITLMFLSSHFVGDDGRFANNGWLQEIPHPVSKVCWDNYAAISPATAKELNVEMDDMLKVSINGKELEMPAFIQPGLADKLVAIELGYGRTHAGEIGNGVGFNANTLMSKKGGISNLIYTGARVSKGNGTYKLVSTQEHHSLDDEFTKDFQFKRDIIREASVADYMHHPDMFKHGGHEVFSITQDIPYNDVKWGMAIDMNKCTGCSQCVAACNVENNIAVVGKDQVEVGREMHWMRLDRYYTGTPDNPGVNHQPMLCQHCDNAPCENVCPVVATTHSPDGLNQMVYNRCVGTRYCANNCPYKVRRFNFFDFRDHVADSYYKGDSLELLHNPEVTIRARGVMEKCTFCVQRISEARSNATRDGKELKGSNVVTACQEACPADAIVFGDVNDPESKVSKLRKHNLGYHVLELINVRPNVTYLARLKNTKAEDKS